ncbi:hypothetical protein ACA910_002502 [Epithemia clementina (nom. ined.)]
MNDTCSSRRTYRTLDWRLATHNSTSAIFPAAPVAGVARQNGMHRLVQQTSKEMAVQQPHKNIRGPTARFALEENGSKRLVLLGGSAAAATGNSNRNSPTGIFLPTQRQRRRLPPNRELWRHTRLGQCETVVVVVKRLISFRGVFSTLNS